jgi:hypothetical protein
MIKLSQVAKDICPPALAAKDALFQRFNTRPSNADRAHIISPKDPPNGRQNGRRERDERKPPGWYSR